jgi:hypothetical protein
MGVAMELCVFAIVIFFERVVARFFTRFPEVRLPGLLVEAGPGGVAFGQPRLGF